jgi:UDP-N-acetyl-D-mannosaminuronate dehydrogenase
VVEAVELVPELEASSDLDKTLAGADVIVVLNSEAAYAEIDWETLSKAERPQYVIDTRGILSDASLGESEIEFDVLGSKQRLS